MTRFQSRNLNTGDLFSDSFISAMQPAEKGLPCATGIRSLFSYAYEYMTKK